MAPLLDNILVNIIKPVKNIWMQIVNIVMTGRSVEFVKVVMLKWMENAHHKI